jgi:hypothetical protein
MQKIDIQVLGQNLNSLAEVYEKKHVTSKALEVWFDTLKGFPTERIMGYLINWPKAHGKFPTPAEVWKLCNESSIEEREEKAKQERAFSAAPWMGSTPEGRRLSALAREIFNRPKRTAKEHWQHVLATSPVGSIGHQYASEALKVKVEEREEEEMAVPF